MACSAYLRNRALKADLNALLHAGAARSGPGQEAAEPGAPDIEGITSRPHGEVDAAVTMNEINDRHGTGPLLKRILRGRTGVLSIRSRDDWGERDFADWHMKISHHGMTRYGSFRNVLRRLDGWRLRSVLCVPYLIDEVMTSIVLREAFGVPLCTYIMDDQNVAEQILPDRAMRELLEKSSLRLATHPELRQAYETKYGLPFALLPAVVPANLVSTVPATPPFDADSPRGVLLGSIWDQSWFDALCATLERCRCTLDWYGNHRSPWLEFPPSRLASAGVRPRGIVSESRLADVLRGSAFAVVPGARLAGGEKNRGVARLSLPGRILFAAATSHTPLLLLGSPETCGARFVAHFGIGETVPYNARRVREAIRRLCRPETQAAMRNSAARMAALFSDEGVSDWLSASIRQGRPVDQRFERAFAGYPPEQAGCGGP